MALTTKPLEDDVQCLYHLLVHYHKFPTDVILPIYLGYVISDWLIFWLMNCTFLIRIDLDNIF